MYSPRAAEMHRPPSMNTGPAGPSSGSRMRGLGNQSSRNSVRCMASGKVGQDLVEGALDPLQILLVLDEHGQGGLDELSIEALGVENHERAGPIEALGHGRR